MAGKTVRTRGSEGGKVRYELSSIFLQKSVWVLEYVLIHILRKNIWEIVMVLRSLGLVLVLVYLKWDPIM